MDSFEKQRKYIGHDFQIFGVREARLSGGKEDNVRIVEVKNGAGLEFTVVPDRALDIANFSYKGVNCAFMAKNGIVNPQYYVEKGKECFYRNFYGGMLYTCGMTHMGAPCVDDGRELGLHGPLSATPAEGFSARIEGSDVPVAVIRGTMRQTAVYDEYIIMDREIRVPFNDNRIILHDSVTNKGYGEQPFMFLYHFNFGYPLLSEHARLVFPEKEMIPRDEIAKSGADNRFKVDKPEDLRPEECFFFRFYAESDGRSAAMLINDSIGIAVVLRFNINQLAYITEWKSMMSGDYALGINPGTYTPMGRVHAREHQKLTFIQPGETKHFDFSLEILDDASEIEKAEQYIRSLKG